MAVDWSITDKIMSQVQEERDAISELRGTLAKIKGKLEDFHLQRSIPSQTQGSGIRTQNTISRYPAFSELKK